MLVIYSSLTGTAQSLAFQASSSPNDKCISADQLDPEDLAKENAVLFVFATHSGGKPAKSGQFCLQWLKEALADFRVGQDFLKGLSYAVCAVGHSAYEQDYNAAGKSLDQVLKAHGARRVVPVLMYDVSNPDSQQLFQEWLSKASERLIKIHSKNESHESKEQLLDLEDMGGVLASKSNASDDDYTGAAGKEMLTSVVRESLTKQGYKVIGSHSGVKICRWTKAMLRGRGGCYKHTFYGISSFQCMEMTPSLACANKLERSGNGLLMSLILS
jgi:tRNA wybutosine-synthesizing protein 1